MSTTSPEPAPAREQEVGVLVFGSCVSRDTFGFLPETFRLLGYVARQSSISAGAPAAGVGARLTTLPSAFQNRVVQGDVEGDLDETLERLADDIDLLLVDLIDERGGVVAAGGGYVTRSLELWNAGGAVATAGGRHIPFSTDEHFGLWSTAVERISERLVELDLLDRTIVLRTPWATSMSSGAAVPVPDWMTPPETANEQFERYFTWLDHLGFTIIPLPPELAKSAPDHRWGPSPFHYTDAAHRYLAGQIRSEVARRWSEYPQG